MYFKMCSYARRDKIIVLEKIQLWLGLFLQIIKDILKPPVGRFSVLNAC